MFDWLGDLIEAIGEMFEECFQGLGEVLTTVIWDSLMKWIYEAVFGALAKFFESINNLGAEVFELKWIQDAVSLFVKFGWGLFVVGVVVAIFDVAIEYQHGRANIRSCCINILKGFFACSLIGVLPIRLYKFCITLQSTFSVELIDSFIEGTRPQSLGELFETCLSFMMESGAGITLMALVELIAFGYCCIKLFFQNLKRGGILITQIAVGSLYMFSVPRGYTDGFNQWVKQVIAICLTAFMQTSLMYLGLLTMTTETVLGLGIMFAANEVPRIAQQFGLDSSVKVNMMSVVHTASTTANLIRMVKK
ncbi:hypothetical protein SAMN02910456_00642 [Ruminococcaceae bacterium YRB3002]|nr:hypothetical protein SAMN02910456_00642 [Ruminococcaceae bacterium YRB3002]